MVNSPEFQRLKKVVKKCASARAISVKTNPKLDKTSEIVEEHVRRYAAAGVSTRVIVFVATRASVQEVVSHLEGSPGNESVLILRVFIYQSKHLNCYRPKAYWIRRSNCEKAGRKRA
jgi:ERCC4-related helicase